MNHPTYPLQAEEAKEIQDALSYSHVDEQNTLRKIREKYRKRRDAEFQGWGQDYERDFQKWLEYQLP